MTSRPIDLSIIIPSYMEAAGIASTLTRLSEFLKTRDYGEVEVVVVVADSPDGTADIAQKHANLFKHFKLVQPGPRVGKGRDVRSGMFEATGHYRVFMDADLATPLIHLDDVHQLMVEEGDIAIAVRNLWSIHHGILRKFMSTFGNVVVQLLLLPGVKDSQCGFKAFRGDIAEDVFSRITMLGWSFDAEALTIARQRHYNIHTFEAPDWSDPKEQSEGLVGDAPLKAAINTFRDLFIIRWRAWTGVYKTVRYTHPSK